MPGRWNQKKLYSFKRDLLRDYCLASLDLQEQFARFDASGVLSFAIISEGIGNSYSKGLLWEVKDTAHHLFRDKARLCPAGSLLDWTIGFLFHECMQVMEAAYQLQYYAPRLAETAKTCQDPNLDNAAKGLTVLSGESHAELARHIVRARQLMETANELFCLYLAGESNNRELARLLYDREPLVRQIFGPLFERLMQSIYSQKPEKMFIEAALSLAETGQMQKARAAAQKAHQIAPDNAELARLLTFLEQINIANV